MRKDFRESYSTYPGDLNVPLGRSTQFRYGCVGCSIIFGVNYRQYHTSAGYTCVLLLQASLSSKPALSSVSFLHSPFSNTSIISALIKCSVSEVMQSDARGFDNKGICYSSHKVKKTGDVAIKNNGRDALEFLVYDGLMILHHPLICELTAVVLYDQNLMGDQLKLRYNCEH